MKTALAVLIGLAASLSTHSARAFGQDGVKVSPTALFAAAMKLQPPTGSIYSAKGKLVCTAFGGGFTGTGAFQSCFVEMDGEQLYLSQIENMKETAELELIADLKNIVPPRASGWSFDGEFEVSSVNTGWAPATYSAIVRAR